MPKPKSKQNNNHIPAAFTQKKLAILAEIKNATSPTYTDKSPKGTIDAEIIDLIGEINACEGYVTTSSCAGRVAVFVEGGRGAVDGGIGGKDGDGGAGEGLNEGGGRGDGDETEDVNGPSRKKTISSGPGGKGHGNRWLYVNHSPVPTQHLTANNPFALHELFGLTPASTSTTPTTSASTSTTTSPGPPQQFTSTSTPPPTPRLIKLSFSPLILHILCANLHAAKHLLSAAINAGFRESGVQSLRALDDHHGAGAGAGAGVMVAVRSAGLGFESVVGVVEGVKGGEVYRSSVGEEYLRLCVGVCNERFGWNGGRRERLRGELRDLKGGEEWEDGDVRRERKRREGLERRERKEREAEGERESTSKREDRAEEIDGLGDGLFMGDS